eukprot:TRINITY_DN14607_c0_g1_i1.p1 TRINITY_DN14607_c0_g1~~TRINITY_DN14607_c0_g1_i1.p1  ORF type:complete len:239 (+),score=62.37 TRINITY_DN14607_c0_g1_i1:113-829(+)
MPCCDTRRSLAASAPRSRCSDQPMSPPSSLRLQQGQGGGEDRQKLLALSMGGGRCCKQSLGMMAAASGVGNCRAARAASKAALSLPFVPPPGLTRCIAEQPSVPEPSVPGWLQLEKSNSATKKSKAVSTRREQLRRKGAQILTATGTWPARRSAAKLDDKASVKAEQKETKDQQYQQPQQKTREITIWLEARAAPQSPTGSSSTRSDDSSAPSSGGSSQTKPPQVLCPNLKEDMPMKT